MPYALSNGVRIYFEECGAGTPILFLHEFAGDHRSWIDQSRHLARGWRCITMSARGYPPSDVPTDEAAYSQDLANRDAIAVLDHLGIDRAHLIGLSMGAYTALQLAMHVPERVRSAIPCGGGSGSYPPQREQFIREAIERAAAFERAGKVPAEAMSHGPTRVQLLNKDPQGWRIATDHFASHPAAGSARVLRNIQAKRPSLYDLEAGLAAVKAPVLLIVGDEDEPCLDVNLWMKRRMPTAQLVVLPGTGHVLTAEEPALVNSLMERFLSSVDRGTWRPRDPRAAPTGMSAFGPTGEAGKGR